MSKVPTSEELGPEFCRILSKWLKPEEIREVTRLNTLPEYANCCASHDFCDSNQAMIDAMEICGIEFHPDQWIELVNAAWDLAKEKKFGTDPAPEESC